MKTIALEEKGEFKERELLAKVVRDSPLRPDGHPMGYTLGEMKTALAVLTKIEALDGAGDLELEDAEYAFVRQRLLGQRWIEANADVFAFGSKFD